ncbi:MAG TPA: hypothetical protein VGJ61_04280 [Solirubrobacterales bacterium]|jgi:hypothetical protein
MEPVERVLDQHADSLLGIAGVVGVAVGRLDDAPCLKVYLARDDPELRRRLPDELGGYPVVAEESGEFHALGDG